MPPRIGKNARGKTAPPIKKAPGAAAEGTSTAASTATTATATATATASKPNGDQIVTKAADQALLSQVFSQYEDKKYAASIKSADLLLKKYPNNAQTTCMKGLSTYNMGKREEGRHLAEKGLALDPTSHVCWHVNALICRAEREYEQALECYISGSKIEPNDLNILRDTINLQLFLRKYADAATSRLNLLRLQPRLRYSWTALAVARHLSNDYAGAIEMLSTYSDMLEDIPAHDYDFSEVVLYKIQVQLEAGQPQSAYETLEKDGKRIVDLQSKKEVNAQLLKALGKSKQAELAYGDLLQDNPDSKEYLVQYLGCRGIVLASLDDANRQDAIGALSDLSDRFPRSRTIRRTVLDVAVEDTFRRRLSIYIVDGLTKGIPSLFGDLKRLLDDEKRRELVLQVLQSMKDNMESGRTIDGDDIVSGSSSSGEGSSSAPQEEEAPTTYIWLLYLLAQVQLHLRSFDDALATIQLALSHTPVLPELWMIQARIHKRMGDIYAAEESMAAARALDGQDRFLNAKHVKYLLRIDEVHEAEKVAALFIRKDSVDALTDLTEMQCLWFLLEEAESYARQGNLGMALKRYMTIERVFSEIYEDEFEFHSYCMRKFTLRACVNMARSNNALRKHPAFIRAAQGAISILLQLEANPYEKPSANGSHAASANGEGGDALNEEERRKAEKKAKKAEAKAKAAAAASADDGKKGAASAADEVAKEKEDDDPAGEKLWGTKTPLKDLEPFLSHLERLGEDNALAQELVHEVAMRKKEYLRALRALQRTHAISPDSPTLHYHIIRFALLFGSPSSDSGIPPEFEAALKAELEPLIPLSSVSPQAFSTDYLQKHPGSAEVILSAARAHWAISKDAQATSELLLQMAEPENKPTLRDLRAAQLFLQSDVGADQTQLEAFRSAAAGVFPRATAFRSAEQNEEQQAAIAERRRKEKAAGNEDAEP